MDTQDKRFIAGALGEGARARAGPGQPHINLVIYQHVRRVTIIQVNSKKGRNLENEHGSVICGCPGPARARAPYRFSSKCDSMPIPENLAKEERPP